MSMCDKGIDCKECSMRGMCDSYALFCYKQGKSDAIDECIDILNDSIPLVDNMDIIFGFKCAVERLEQLKEK